MKLCDVCHVNPKAPGRGRRTCDSCKGLCKTCKGPLDARSRCGECIKVRNRTRYQNDPEYAERKRIGNKLSLYGISRDEYDALEWRCEGCGSVENLRIDHSHETGKVRGILCNGCNTAIGLLKESRETMKNLMTYLEETEGAHDSNPA